MTRYRRVFMERDRAVELTELLARAWPPRSVVELDGWRLRVGHGLPDYALSAWPRSCGSRVPLHVRVDGTLRHYTEAGLPARVLVTPAAQPRGLDATLAERGWIKRRPADVRTGDLDALAALQPGEGTTTAATAEATDEWLAGWARLTGRDRSQASGAAVSLARLEAPSLFVRAWRHGELAGTARAVSDGGWMGLPDMAVPDGDPDVAASLARTAAAWAATGGIEHAWWLVAHDESAAGEAARRARLHPDLRVHLREAQRTVR